MENKGQKHFWTEEEKAYLIEKYADTPTKKIAEHLGISISKIYWYANNIGLKKSKECIAQTSKENISESFMYSGKGRIPHNKGVPMSEEAYEKCKHTFFKKGQKPHNTKEADGEIVVRRNNGWKTLWIRVELGKWEQLHRWVWKQANGEIPKGSVIAFIDGDSMNCDLRNLKMISRADNMRRNSINYLPQEIKDILHVKAAFQRKLNTIIKRYYGKTKN